MVLFAAVGLALFLLLRPPPPEKLYEQAKGLMMSQDVGKHIEALEGPIRQYLVHYGEVPGERTGKDSQLGR